ncbi:hypothetical protein QVD17_04894 [Tagetes erecta]|uniref:Uncharacterized protein n=1 Tax=Tagetes erecta TaxID=13708 RepID=A0AAD8LAZ9_TARER|nr:hypothetical protein QVD17_04894 [Tagetes erecta]
MEMEIISKEVIKPSSPTPNHLKTFKLSLIDQLTLHSYTPILLLYNSHHTNSSHILKQSLSETLTKYYPFAGRLENDGVTVDCGDQGVVFVEAKIRGCTVSEFLADPKFETQRLLYPEGFLWKDSCIGHTFLAVQTTSFEGGGMAVTIAISHKIVDGCSTATFLNDWAAVARSEDRSPPTFLAKSIPSLDLGYIMPEIVVNKAKTCVTRRFVFRAQKIAQLIQSVLGIVENPTRGELVTALLYKCAVTALTEKTGCFINSNLIQLVNMRRRLATPLPDDSIGNFSWYFTISNNHESEIMNLGKLVLQLKKKIKELRDGEDYQSLNDWLTSVVESIKNAKELFGDVDVYRCSDMHNMPYYQTDFGWGNPRWVTIPDLLVKNMFVLFNTPDGDGIEAMVTLEEDHMRLFQSSPQLLEFASTPI